MGFDQTDHYLPSMKGLADATRLRLVAILQSGAFNVNELVGVLGMGQSRVSRHLKILLDAGLVETRREGVRVYYRLSDDWTGNRSRANRARAPLRYLRILGHELRSELNGDQDAVERCLQKRRETANAFFKRVAPEWDAHRDQVQGPPKYAADVAQNLGPDDTVVDLGTGTGVLLHVLSEHAKTVIGVDASAEMLQVARRNALERELDNVDLRLGTLEHLPVPDGVVDAMVANMVLHHVAHPPDALNEVHRGLRPGGRFILADLAEHSDEAYRERLGDLWLGFARNDVEGWLEDTGFAIDEFHELSSDTGGPSVLFVSATRKRDRGASSPTTTTRKAKKKSGSKNKKKTSSRHSTPSTART